MGWTQQDLADRLAVSRVAVSHIESGVSDPGERTVTLLASVFKIEPFELVAGTAYPSARAERLPVVVARYTEVEMQLTLLEHDLQRLDPREPSCSSAERGDTAPALVRWQARLGLLLDMAHDRRERQALAEAQVRVREALDRTVT